MSIVLPTFRRPEFLERAVVSVVAQSVDAWELLVIDDNDPASDDRRLTEELVGSFTTDPRVRYVRHPENRGGGAARNTGIAAAKARFVAFLDDDDEWHPDKLERQLACIEDAPPTLGLVYCRVEIVEDDGAPRPWPTSGRDHGTHDLLQRNTVGTTSCVLCRRAALDAVGRFDETLEARQDVDLYIRLAGRYEFAFVDAPLVTRHRQATSSISTNLDGAIRAQQLFWEKYRTAIESDPDILHARLYELGTLLVDAGRYAEARATLLRAWRIRRGDRDVIARLAMTYRAARALAPAAKRVLAPRRGPGRSTA